MGVLNMAFGGLSTMQLVATTSILLPFLLVGWIVYARSLHPMAQIPGPFLASITRLWYAQKVKEGNFDKVIRKLHAELGPMVRIAPNEVSISDPEAIKTIYGINSGFPKTDFYLAFRSAGFQTVHPDVFTTLENDAHAKRRKLLINIYSMSSIMELESYIDKCSELFLKRLREFAKEGKEVDLGEWLRMYAFDVIGELYFGEMFGFMETSSDYNNYMEFTDVLLPVLSIAAVLPKWGRTPFLMSGLLFPSIRRALPCIDRVDAAAKEHVGKRQAKLESGKAQQESRRDFLAKLFELKDEKGLSADFSIADIQQEAYVALVAGSDTTAIAMRSILHNIIKHPEVYQRLVKEIDDAASSGAITFPTKYADAIKLPYFVACCKEGMRMHPSLGLHLARHVPPGGRQISGVHFATGCRVGVNAAVIHFDKSVFGDDADQFVPERWFRESATNMDRYMFQFGGGNRTCIGKNISLAEIHKLFPMLLRYLKFELVGAEKEMKTFDWWFHVQTGFNVKVSSRQLA